MQERDGPMEIKHPLSNPYNAYLPSVSPTPDGHRGRLPASPDRDRRPRAEETIYLRQEDLTVLPGDREAVTYDGGGRIVRDSRPATPARKGVLIDIKA